MGSGLYFGGSVSGMYLGSSEVKAAYLGSVKVYDQASVNTVHIGENDYPFVQIGSQLWTTKYLMENVGRKYSPLDKEIYGYFYDPWSLCDAEGTPTDEFAAILHDDWRMPNRADLDKLVRYVSANGGGKAVIRTEEGGTNSLGLGLSIKGVYKYPKVSGAAKGWYQTSYAYMAGAEEHPTSAYCKYVAQANLTSVGTINECENNEEYHYYTIPIRLCKDA